MYEDKDIVSPPAHVSEDSRSTFSPVGNIYSPGSSVYTPIGSYGGPSPNTPNGNPLHNMGNMAEAQQPQMYGNYTNMMTNQMSQMNLDGSGNPVAAAPIRKKKDRHAYHRIDQPQPSTATNEEMLGVPPVNWGAPALSTSQPGQGHGAIPGQMTPQPSTNHQISITSQPGTMPGAAVVGTQPSAAQGRVDTEHIPSVPRSRDLPAKYYQENIYPTMERHLPPPAAVPFVAFDQGNCSPKYARLTVNNIPASQEALNSTGLPLGLILQPLAPLQEGEQAIPVVDYGEEGPPRCRRCRAYINPFMTFRSGGSKFICNMCTHVNDVPSSYFAAIDLSGIRIDRAERPELMLGTVDFTVPKTYWSKEPSPIRWLFLIDVSVEAVNKGFLHSVCEGISNALYPDQDDQAHALNSKRLTPGAKVGIVTYDREVQFYNLSSRLQQAQMIIMSDMPDPFVPISEGLFVDPESSKEVITDLLRRIPAMFAKVPRADPAILPTLDAALLALKETGGKIICSISSLPTFGPGSFFSRDGPQSTDDIPDKKLFTTDGQEWKKCATKMVESGVGVDFLMATPSGGYLDMGTIGHVSSSTGGEVFFYANFHNPRDTERVMKDIHHTLTRETGYQALMKVRCSNGLQISSYHGNFIQQTTGSDLEFGVIDEDKALAVTFSYDGKLDPKLDAHFQSALLYTSSTGQRRVRCSNFVASVSETANEAMKLVDQDAVLGILAKDISSRVIDRDIIEIRTSLTHKTTNILSCYRRNFSLSHPPGQLVLPENLKEFSMYILGLLKTRLLKTGREPSDRRVHDARLIRSMGLTEFSLYLYPRMIALHDLDPADGFPDAKTGRLRIPDSIRASFARVEHGGAYLIDDGQTCLLWLHKYVSPNLLEDLFGQGQSSLEELNPDMSRLPVLETHLNAQVRNICQYWDENRGGRGLVIQLARQGIDGAEYEFARMLIEDAGNDIGSVDYVDWLVGLHRGVQSDVS